MTTRTTGTGCLPLNQWAWTGLTCNGLVCKLSRCEAAVHTNLPRSKEIEGAASRRRREEEAPMNVRLIASVVTCAGLALIAATTGKTSPQATTLTVWLQEDARDNWPGVVNAANDAFE